MLQAGDMGRNIPEKDQSLQVTLEFVETPGARTRLAQAFRLILTQSTTHEPDLIPSDRRDAAEDTTQDREADL